MLGGGKDCALGLGPTSLTEAEADDGGDLPRWPTGYGPVNVWAAAGPIAAGACAPLLAGELTNPTMLARSICLEHIALCIACLCDVLREYASRSLSANTFTNVT